MTHLAKIKLRYFKEQKLETLKLNWQMLFFRMTFLGLLLLVVHHIPQIDLLFVDIKIQILQVTGCFIIHAAVLLVIKFQDHLPGR